MTAATNEIKSGTRIIISTSGPAKFRPYWLDSPPRLVIEFQSRNVISKIDREVIINQGIMKRITSSYFERGGNKALKSLTFELLEKVPYQIWQENNGIMLDIQSPIETSIFYIGGEETSARGETSGVIIERLEAMDMALTEITESQSPSGTPKTEIKEEVLEEINKAEEEVVSPKVIPFPLAEPTRRRKGIVNIVYWFIGLALISGLGCLAWRRRRLNTDQRLKKLELELQEKNKRLEQEKTIRKAVEKASLQKEKEYEQLRNSFESTKATLIEKGLIRRELSPEEKEKPWIPEESKERRFSPRVPLTRDFIRTIIARIESPNIAQSIKSFARDISSEGLCFETTKEFGEKEPINLRLFFYGDPVPSIKIQAHTVWKKAVGPINYYGVYFDSIDEKDKVELNRYMESKIE